MVPVRPNSIATLRKTLVGDALPLSPLVYEFGNSWLSSLMLCLLVILVRYFATEILDIGWAKAYERQRVKLGLSICAILLGEASYRAWTWWGRMCANTETDCGWMLLHVWPMVPVASIVVQVIGCLCMIRVLSPDTWGRHSWVIAMVLSVSWSMFWFSGWHDVLAYFGQ